MVDQNLEVCSRCDMDKSEWSEEAGYQKDGEIYCCSGCADDTGCLCEGDVERPQQPGGFAGI